MVICWDSVCSDNFSRYLSLYMKTGAMTRGNEILNVNKYLLFGFFLGENLFEEKVLPKPLSKTFLGGCCRFVWLI